MTREDALPLTSTSACCSRVVVAMTGRRGRQSKVDSTIVHTLSIEQDIANLEKSANTLWYSIRESIDETKSVADLVREIEASRARVTDAPTRNYQQGCFIWINLS